MAKPNRSVLSSTSLIIASTLFITFTFFRLVRLESNPPGFFSDEASTAYNAYSIIKTGRDEHATNFPLFFKAFGEYKSPIYIYSQIPFLALTGPSISASRSASAFWGLLTVWVIFLATRSLTRSTQTAIITSLFLLTNPTHFLLSRVSFEVISYFFFLTLSLHYLFRFHHSSSQIRLFYFFVFFQAASFYSYTAAKFLSFSLVASALFFFRQKLNLKAFLTSTFIFISTLFPAFLWESLFPGSLFSRFQTVALPSLPATTFLSTLVHHYTQHFHPNFLFGSGDAIYRHSPVWHSIFLWTTAPFILLGLVQLILQIRQPLYRWLVFGFSLSPLPAAITTQSPHVLRSSSLLIFGLTLASLGYRHLQVKTSPKLLLFVTTIILTVESINFLHYFFSYFPSQAAPSFETQPVTVLKAAANLPGPYFFPYYPFRPGLSVTWLFLKSHPPGLHPHSIANDTYYFTTQVPTSPSGTYILSPSQCRQPPEFLHSAINLPTSTPFCLYYLPN